MKLLLALCLAAAVLPLAGCSSDRSDYSSHGATYDPYMTGSAGESHPEPAGSPTFRPGMTPYDPRDPHFITRPQPFQQPPNP